MDYHPANHIPSPLWPLCIPSRMGPSAFEPPPWAAGTRAYSVPAWRAGGRAVNRDGRWRVCAALAVDTSPSARTWNIPGTDGAKCFPYTPRGSRTSGRATSSRSIVPPAITSRCSRRSFCCGSGSVPRPRCWISKGGSDAEDAERKDELCFRSSGAGRAGEPAHSWPVATLRLPGTALRREPTNALRADKQRFRYIIASSRVSGWRATFPDRALQVT
jgi:hypothetical protein